MVLPARTPTWSERLRAGRLCVLGSVSLTVDDRTTTLAGLPARVVIALAVADGREVPPGELIELLWGPDAPPSVRASLHVHVSTARRWLGRSGDRAAIARSSVGYRLALDGIELDASLMTDLVASAHRTLDTTPLVALDMLRSAGEMWTGSLLEQPWAAVPAGVRRLEATKLTAEELLVETLLTVGEWWQAEQHARALVEREPFRELRWAQLIRARYLDSRPRDALSTYQQVRALLAEELGTDPGPMLRELERAVLVHDLPTIRRGPSDRRPRRVTVAAGPPLVGRDDELRRCATALGAGRAVVVHGPPGVGKTRLVSEVCRTMPALDRVVWAEAGGFDHPLQALATALDLPRDSTWREVSEHLADPRTLLVIDDAEHLAEQVVTETARWCRTLPELMVVVVSRVRLSMPAVFVELRPLPLGTGDGAEPAGADETSTDTTDTDTTDEETDDSPAVQLMRDSLSELAPHVRLDDGEVRELAARTGGLPLAIRVAAGAVRALDSTLRSSSVQLEVSNRLSPLLADTLALIDAAAVEHYGALAVVRGEFDAELGAAVLGLSVDEFRPVIVALVDHGLVEVVAGPRSSYRLLAPLREAATMLEVGDDVRRQARDRLAAWCIGSAHELVARMRRGDPVADVESEVRRVVPKAVQSLDHLESTGQSDVALALAGALESPLYTVGWWHERTSLLRRALAVPGEPSARRARVMATAARPGPLSLTDVDALEAAAEMAHDLGEHVLEVFARHLQSIGRWWRGEAVAAVETNRWAADEFRAAGRVLEELEASKFLGVAMASAGDAAGGIAVLHDVLDRYRTLGIDFHVAHTLAYLGYVQREAGDDDSATADFAASLDICRRIGNRASAIHVTISLGELALERGDAALADEHAADALRLGTASRNGIYEPWAWTLAMCAAHADGDLARAAACGARALAALDGRTTGDGARFAGALAHLAASVGEPRRAAVLIGYANSVCVPRELPFVSARERAERLRFETELAEQLGDEFASSAASGARLTIDEACRPVIEHLRRLGARAIASTRVAADERG